MAEMMLRSAGAVPPMRLLLAPLREDEDAEEVAGPRGRAGQVAVPRKFPAMMLFGRPSMKMALPLGGGAVDAPVRG